MRPLFALLLLSAATLAYQIALMRAFSISLWHHFAYMVISIALLGFGASGTFLALWRRRDDQGPANFAGLAALFALSLPVCFAVAQRVPFNPFSLLWEPRQLLGLSLYYLVLFVPFFLAATAIGLLLLERARQAPRVYFFNLLGSGFGSLLAVIFLFLVPAERAVLLIYALAAGAALLVVDALPPRRGAAVVLSLAAAFYAFHFGGLLAIQPSQYKGLSVALNLPGAQILAQRSSPLGRVDILRSPAFRHAPGLSLVSPALPAPQLGVFIDAESAGAYTAFDDHRESVAFLDWTSAAAPFHLVPAAAGARVLVLGAGGGSDVLLALYHGAARIDAVELNPHVLALARREFADFTGHLFHRPQVSVHLGEARSFLEHTARHAGAAQFDLIQISLLDSLAASAAGVHALNENYLYTVEALDRATGLLAPNGTLAITRWLKMPPRDSLKLFLTAVTALEARGVPRPGDHLALVRSWATATLLVKRSPFTPDEIAALKQFGDERLFDLDYFPGIRPEDANRFNRLDRSYYFEAARDILAGGERRAALLRDYPFNLAPATDDRPFFDHFFRWRALPMLLGAYGRQGLPFLEWGYLVLVATLLQAVAFSVVLILLPLLFRRLSFFPDCHSEEAVGRRGTCFTPPSRSRVALYFFGIGLGFLFLEIVLIQKFTFFLGHPLYAVVVVLAGVLVFSGVGSSLAGRLQQRGSAFAAPARACAAVAALALLLAFLLPLLLPPLLGLPVAARIVITLLLLAPPALLMGMPFPLAWQRLESARPALLPWAWGINGCASVVAAVLATLLAMSFGFRVVFLSAAGFYLLAAAAAARLQSVESGN